MPARPPEKAGSAARAGELSARRCPICGKPALEAAKPFCSDRCKDVDLNRWLSGSYVVLGRPEADEDAD